MAPPAAVFALEVLEILGMGMLWTSLPILLESDTRPQRYGLITGIASAIGLATGAVFGRLSDVHGRQPVLLLAVLVFASANVFLAAAQLPQILFEAAGVAPTTVLVLGALLGRCSTTGGALRKALVSDLSPPAERTTALGRLAACGGVGFVIGPTLAGRLADIDVNLSVRAQLLLASLATCTAVLIWRDNKAAAAASARLSSGSKGIKQPLICEASSSGFSLTNLLSSRAVSGLVVAQLFLSFGFQAFTSSFYLYCVRRFDFGPIEFGQLLSCLGMTWTATQALVIPRLRHHGQPESRILVTGAFVLTCGRLALAFAYSVPQLLFGELLVVSGAATCFTITSSLLSQAVPADQVRLQFAFE
jgi:DHA1 family tetracycline resistance protein-like MFS transporter